MDFKFRISIFCFGFYLLFLHEPIADHIKSGSYVLNGTFIYQACDPSKCIPHWDDFSLKLKIESGLVRPNYLFPVQTDYDLSETKSAHIHSRKLYQSVERPEQSAHRINEGLNTLRIK